MLFISRRTLRVTSNKEVERNSESERDESSMGMIEINFTNVHAFKKLKLLTNCNGVSNAYHLKSSTESMQLKVMDASIIFQASPPLSTLGK